MKKLLFILAMGCIALTSCKQEKSNEFSLNGKIDNFTDSVRLTLFVSTGSTLEPILQEMVGEEFYLQVPYDFSNQELSAMIRLNVEGRGWENRLRDVWIKPGAKIYATFRNGETYSAEIRSNVKEQKWQERLEKAKREVQERGLRNYQLSMACSRQTNDPQLTKEEKQTLMDSAEYYWKGYIDAAQEEPGKAVKPLRKMPHNKVWWVQMERLATMASYYPDADYAEGAKELFLSLRDKEKQTDQAQRVQKMLFPPEPYKIGDLVDAQLVDMEGDSCRLSDFRGKFVLLDLWSIGCGACYAAEPMLAEAAEKFADKLAIISINTNSREEWKRYATLSHISWYNMQDTEGEYGLFQRNGCHAWPTFVLLGPEGKKLDQVVGVPASIEAYLSEQFEKLEAR